MTNQEIITRGELIRDETVKGANTAQRVGEAFIAIGENLEEEKRNFGEEILKINTVRGDKYTNYERRTGAYIDTHGSIGTTGAAQFVVDTYQVTPNVIYNIDFNVGGFSAYNRAWGAAYDSNDNVVEVFGILPKQSDTTTDDDKIRRKTYIVPDNVTKVRFGFNTDFDGYANLYLTKEYNIQGKISDVEGEIEKITIAKDEEIEATNIVDKKVLQPNGDVHSITTSGYVVATFGVVAGNTYCIDYHTDNLGLNQRAWGAVYDDNDNVIEVLGLLKTGNDETVTDDDKNFTRYCRIPQSATKLRLGYNNGHSTESKLYSTTKIEDIGQKVKESEDSVAKIEELSDVVSENTHIADTVLSYADRLDNNAIGTSGIIVSFSGQQGYYVDTFNVLPNTTYYIDYATFKVGANKRLWGAVYKVVNGEDVMIHALGELPVASDNPTSDELVHKVFYTTPADAQKIKLGYHPDNNTTSKISTVKEFNIPQKIMEIEQAASGGDNVSQTIIVNPKIDLRKSNLKVLHIGNSFMAGATTYLSQFVNAASIDVSDMCLYLANRSSGSFKSWYNTYHDADTSGYSITKCIGGLDLNTEIGITTGTGGNNGSFAAGDGSGFRNALVNVKWDLIIIQQVSSYSGEYDGWEGSGNGGYLKEFLRIIRTYQPQASLGWHLCHASPNQSPDGTYARYLQIVSATKKMASRYGIDFIIPYGTAIENLRISSLNTTPNQFTFDNHHLAHGLAQYVANASYFQALIAPRYGISVLGNSLRITVPQSTKNTYRDYVNNFVDVDESNYHEAQMCAILAANNMYEMINPDGVNL